MKSKNLFLAVVLGFLSIGSSSCQLSPDSPEITVINKTGNNIPLLRVKVTLVGDKGTSVEGSIHIPNFPNASWFFLPGYAKVNALQATRWRASEEDIREADGNVEVARKYAKARYLTQGGEIPTNQVDDFTWTTEIGRLVAQGYREKLVDVLAAKDETVVGVYLTKVKAYRIIEGREAQEREEILNNKFEKPGILSSTISIVTLEEPIEKTKRRRGQHLIYDEEGKVMNLIYGIQVDGE